MYLSRLTIDGFRGLNSLEMRFREGLNILVGPNNAGKTSVVDALRVLLSVGDEGALRVMDYDLHLPDAAAKLEQMTFKFVFQGLDETDEADFLTALKPIVGAKPIQYEAHITVRYSGGDVGGRLRVKRWCGDHEQNPVTTEMLEDLRSIYLPPLRDPAQGLKPGRSSQLSRLVTRLSDDAGRKDVTETLAKLDQDLQGKKPIADTQAAVKKRHLDMLGQVLSQVLAVNLSPTDFQRVAARLALSVGNLEADQNGLGFNNLIYMAVVLSELSMSTEAAYRALIIEEPEAHLHPQLQAVLLQYLQTVEKPAEKERPVQIFVTSHSPHFAALGDIDSIGCIFQSAGKVKTFFPRDVSFPPRKKEKLQRYLNVTRADVFFARRIIFVEGAAELFVVEALAAKLGISLRKHAVSVISVDGLNFDAFLPLFGEKKLDVRVAVVTDGDPPDTYPKPDDTPAMSAAARKLAEYESATVKLFFAAKTLEYDLALSHKNRTTMLEALSDIHPEIAKALKSEVDNAVEVDKARVLFQGMFERGAGKTNVQKGAFGQALAQAVLAEKMDFEVPGYIAEALSFVSAE